MSESVSNFNFFDQLSYKLISSNHPKRIEIYVKRILSIDYWLKGNFFWQKKNRDPGVKFVYKNKIFKKKEKNLIYFGDSHVEFLSRFLDHENELIPSKNKSMWLGPRTVIGINVKQNIIDLRKKIKIISKNIKGSEHKIIFSLGSIDVRCLFYEMLLRKLVRNEKEIYKIFKKNLNVFLKEVKILKSKNKKISFFFLGLFNSPAKGFEKNKIEDLIRYKENKNFPTLGSIKNRKKWTKGVNDILKKESNKFRIQFISTEKLMKKVEKIDKIDNVHLSSDLLMNNIYNYIQKIG